MAAFRMYRGIEARGCGISLAAILYRISPKSRPTLLPICDRSPTELTHAIGRNAFPTGSLPINNTYCISRNESTLRWYSVQGENESVNEVVDRYSSCSG